MHNYVNFNGRASRSEYWWFFLFGFLTAIPAMILDGLTGIELIDAGAGVSHATGPREMALPDASAAIACAT